MIPAKRTSHYTQGSPPSSSRDSPMYSPPYDASPPYPHKRTSSSRRSSTTSRQGSVDRDEDMTTRTGMQQTPTSTQEPSTTDGVNDKDDGDAEEDDKDELVMDDDMHAQMEKAKEDMKILLENFTEDQLQRYEAYRRSALNRTNVKRLVSQVMNQQCSQTMAFVVAGFAKVYVGEIVEKAREVMEEWGQSGAIRPDHIREAHRRYKQSSSSSSAIGKKMLKR
ncbi:hTAFII28-like protein conserved region-domain-containing protein [Halteromyces radiatus]|uniref:hTAFII28-like protein conserved region-domain-containing protein n=1 Tax=Halteromyces radiatus TaxID=101107 RepID=UPI0022209593|nr:hTAFII28-like protein conserved region-domain-containing protein [Halteromyces radiatus]KAI8099018.1 hTAFII28-like protein conserved region-domain-containing protein [Halteromyces radiatus]